MRKSQQAQTEGAVTSQPPVHRFPKTDLRYWKEKVFLLGSTYWAQIQFSGRREKINLHQAGVDQAASKARDLYRSLLSNGWEETLKRFKAGYTEPKKSDLTLGEYVELVKQQTGLGSKTVESYAVALRKIAADIFGLSKDKAKYHPTKRLKWRMRINGIPLSNLTNERIEEWRLRFVKQAGTDPIEERKAKRSAEAFIRRARALFGKKVVTSLDRSLKLPSPIPFTGIKVEKTKPPRYRSSFDLIKVAAEARAELSKDHPMPYRIFLLAAMAGLRRHEIDLLPWTAFRWTQNKIRIERTKFFRPKTEDSERDIEVDSELLQVFGLYYATRNSEFVIESDVLPKPAANFDHYRCWTDFQNLIEWLRGKGLKDSRTPLHDLRKEYGSQICDRFGIYAAQTVLGHSDPAITAAHYLEKKKPAVLGIGHLLLGEPKVIPLPDAAANQ